MERKTLSRRGLLRSAALGSTALAAGSFGMPFIHSAFSAGTLDVGLWDHWVPGGNDAWKKLAKEWGDKNHVDVNLDFITSQGDKLNITIAAEAQAGSGHDILRFADSQPGAYGESLETVDDITVGLIKDFGKELEGSKYGGFHDGHWTAVPVSQGTIAAPSCGRIDLLKKYGGLDVQKMYPDGAPPDKELVDRWTWDTFLTLAEKMNKAGYPFGLPLSTWSDANNFVNSVFASYGAYLVDEKGNTTLDNDQTKQVLEWFKKLVPQLPDSVFAWDNAQNNKWLVSGQGSLIQNPPSAWAVAVRDRPDIGKELWHFPSPKGPKGRYVGTNFGFLGIWDFSPNKSAAKDFIRYVTTKPAFEEIVTASRGYDIPPYENLRNFKIWETEGPPKGVNYNYPPRGDVISLMIGYPAPTEIANHLYAQGTICKLVARFAQQGMSMKDALAETVEEIEGYKRT